MNGLIDRIYESAFNPEIFRNVINEISNIAECEKAFVFCTRDGLSVESYIEDKASHGIVRNLVESGYIKNNPQAPTLIKNPEPRFVGDHDIFSDEQINNEYRDFYYNFLEKNGAFWGTGTLIRVSSGENIIYSFHRPFLRGPIDSVLVDQLTALRPHLARSAFVAARLKMLEAQKMVSALADLRLPAATVSSTGRLHVANSLFTTLVPSILADFSSRIRFSNREADNKFQDALSRRQGMESGLGSVTFAACSSLESCAPVVAHMVPIVGNSRDIFVGGSWLLVAVPVAISSPDPLVLEGLFDLTVAEAHVARGIAEGRSLEAIAQLRKTTIETVRSQLKAVMQKTATSRQNELAALLQNGGIAKFYSNGDSP